jgi:phosphoribosyl-ATP pyrophosphohydrolase/phosphoribosyl-AMP cyclohydrolase
MSEAAAAAPELRWDEHGLIPAVVVHARTGAPLMLAYMNQEALARTSATGEVHFYSRSRRSLWRKGETSGNTLAVRELRLDCDGDALLVLAEPAGPTCHTGKTSCFHQPLPASIPADDGPAGPRAAVLERVAAVLAARKRAPRDAARPSYTQTLLDGGMAAIMGKIAEEHGELLAELPAGAPADVVHETADLLFHLLVALIARDIPIEAVWAELDRRFGVGGHREKAARSAG